MKRALVVTLVLLLLAGCDSEVWQPCGLEKRQTTERYGHPERVTRYTTTGYSSETWWYDSIGRAVGFTLASGRGCRVSAYSWTR